MNKGITRVILKSIAFIALVYEIRIERNEENNIDNKSENKLIIILGLMAFLTNGENYAAAPLNINISKDLNISVSTAAILVTAYMLAFGLFTLIFRPMSEIGLGK